MGCSRRRHWHRFSVSIPCGQGFSGRGVASSIFVQMLLHGFIVHKVFKLPAK
jgi:hypothetical protein